MIPYDMLITHPNAETELDARVACIAACLDCVTCCTACADACLAEDDVSDLRQCIRLNLDCADLCATIGRIVTRGTGLNEILLAEVINLCALICRMCAAECARHEEQHEHCRICALACRSCAEACGEAIRSLRGVS